MLHLSDTPPAPVAEDAISFPSVAQAVQYSLNHYGACPVSVADECTPSHAA